MGASLLRSIARIVSKMRFLILAALFSLAACASVGRNQQWEEFKGAFRREFRDLKHESERRQVFESNLDFIEYHNAKFEKGLSSYKMGVNQFTDMTYEEFSNIMLMETRYNMQAASDEVSQMKKPKSSTPSHHDWRDEGVLNDVKDQKSCGSCWAFSAVGSTEAAWARAGNGLVSLSEQELVDCGAGDCNGGWVDRAFDTILDQGGLMSEEDYPYTAHNAVHGCQYDDDKKVASISGYQRLRGDISADSVYENGPHSIYLYANSNFQHYSSGIFDDAGCPKYSYNHAVVNIGYNDDEGYWTIRNSWAASWGEEGHIRIAQGKNICNCEKYAWYPEI